MTFHEKKTFTDTTSPILEVDLELTDEEITQISSFLGAGSMRLRAAREANYPKKCSEWSLFPTSNKFFHYDSPCVHFDFL